MAYHRHHGLDVRIVRIFNTYGPFMRPDDGRAVSNFLTQALRGKPITIYGDGSQTRSFTYVDDEIRGFLALLDSDVVTPVNIGNDNEFTIAELADARARGDRLVERAGAASPCPWTIPTQRKPDLTLVPASGSVGPPRSGLREGLERTAAYFRRRIFG